MIRPRGLPSRYELKAHLGSGAFGRVYLAYDKELNIDVAIKISPFGGRLNVSGDEIRRRAKREILASGRISHPNIVKIYDAHIIDDYAYIVMEVITGGSLEELVEKGPVAPTRALSMIGQLADALDHLHSLSIIHRDIKSANILILPSFQAKLMDFNLVRVTDETAMTATGSLVGTPVYIAPEVFEGQPASSSSDIYALGVVLWSMLTGRRPFDECKDFGQVVQAKLKKGLSAPSKVLPILSPSIDAIVQKATAQDPNERFADGATFSRACLKLSAVDFENTEEISALSIDSLLDNTGKNSAVRNSALRHIGYGRRLLFILSLAILLIVFISKPSPRENPAKPTIHFGQPKLSARAKGTMVLWQCSQSITNPRVICLDSKKELPVEALFGKAYRTEIPIEWRLNKECRLQIRASSVTGEHTQSQVATLPKLPLTDFIIYTKSLDDLQAIDLKSKLPLLNKGKKSAAQMVLSRQRIFAASQLSFQKKLALYRALLKLRKVDIFLAARNDEPMFNIGNKMGFVNHYVLRNTPFAQWEDWPQDAFFWRPKTSQRYLLPRPPRGSSSSINFFTNMTKTRPKTSLKATISEDFLSSCRNGRALIYLCIKMPSPSIMLTLELNKSFPLIFWGSWVMGNVNRQHHVAEFPAKLLRAGTNEITIAVQSTTVLVALEPTVVEALSVIKHSLSANEQQFKNNKALLVDRPLDSRPFTK